MRTLATVISLCLGAAVVGFAAPVQDGVQEYVFLGETRPVLLRMQVLVDGKPVQAAWQEMLQYLFTYLDVNGDGVLSKAEAERVPASQQLLGGGGPGRGPGGFNQMSRGPTAPPFASLDADKDGQITLVELGMYYRANGYAPFQLQFDSGQGDAIAGAAAAFLGGPRPDPSVVEVSDGVFALLDTNKDGKLSAEELAATASVLLRMDEDEDEIILPRELVPNARPAANPLAMAGMMGRPERTEADSSKQLLVPIPASGELPANLVSRLLERYGPKSGNVETRKVTRKQLGLEEAAFAKLDANRDGLLDSQELTSFARRAADLELVIRLGKTEAGATRIEVVSGNPTASVLAGKVRTAQGAVVLDLGVTRLDFRIGEESRSGLTSLFAPKQSATSFKQIDTDGNGHLDETEVNNSRTMRGQFKMLDRDGDGKVTEKEFATFSAYQSTLRTRAAAGCVSFTLADQSRGLFDLLDTNHDGRLSLRELRQGSTLLTKLDTEGKGYLTKADIPHRYQLTVKRGPATPGGAGNPAALVELYFGGGQYVTEKQPTEGPLWFRKMDRNRDGDVSPKEFLFSAEAFRKLDLDKDGLISTEEAVKAPALGDQEE